MVPGTALAPRTPRVAPNDGTACLCVYKDTRHAASGAPDTEKKAPHRKEGKA